MIKVPCPRCDGEIETEVKEDDGPMVFVICPDCTHVFTVIL